LTAFLSGPYATQTLADLGADVVKVEPPSGDSSRAIPPHFINGESAYFLSVNRNKRSIALDLRTSEGQAMVNKLAEAADVVVENFRPGVIERLGLSYRDLAARKPSIVWCSISGFGATGPYRDRPAYDMIVQAMSGGMSMTGEKGGRPVRSGIPIGDISAGMFAVIGILAALHDRDATGRGRQVDISMLDCQISMLSYQGVYHLLAGVEPGPQGRGHDSIPTYRSFMTEDGTDVIITANTEAMWLSLCDVLKLPQLKTDQRFIDNESRYANRTQLWELLELAFTREPGSAWLDKLHEAGIPAARVNTVSEALADPQVRQRNMVVSPVDAGDDEHANGTKLQLLGNPIKFVDTDECDFQRPPRLGEHVNQIMREWLGADIADDATEPRSFEGSSDCPAAMQTGGQRLEGRHDGVC